MILRLKFLFILTGLTFVFCSPTEKAWGARCLCLCSALYSRGGETKFCREGAVSQGRCKDWYFLVSSVNSKESCIALGETVNECSGLYKDQKSRGEWIKGDEGRYHSCRFY